MVEISENTNKKDECWERNVGLNSDGYSQICLGGKNHLAHRVSYRLFNGVVPKNKLVRHSCDNPSCINPKHLLLGTNKSNAQDAVERERYMRGEKHHATYLTGGQVIQLRSLWDSGRWTTTELATKFEVSRSCAWYIATRKTWKHLP